MDPEFLPAPDTSPPFAPAPSPFAPLAAVRHLLAAALSPRFERARPPPGVTFFFADRSGMDVATAWLLAFSSVPELVVIHLLLRHWSHPAANAATALGGVLLLLLLGFARSFSRFPTELGPAELVPRLGGLRTRRIPLAAVIAAAPATGRPSRDARRSAGRLRFWFLDEPNVRLSFRAADGSSAHADLRLDEPAAFLSALSRRGVPVSPSVPAR